MRVKRSEPDAFLRVFDQPEPVQSVGARGIATVPTQALAMMNSPLVRQAAEGLAARVRTMSGRATEPAADTAAEIDRIFLTALSRDPSAAERERFATFLDARRQAAGADQPRREAALVDTCQLVLCLNEFIYVD